MWNRHATHLSGARIIPDEARDERGLPVPVAITLEGALAPGGEVPGDEASGGKAPREKSPEAESREVTYRVGISDFACTDMEGAEDGEDGEDDEPPRPRHTNALENGAITTVLVSVDMIQGSLTASGPGGMFHFSMILLYFLAMVFFCSYFFISGRRILKQMETTNATQQISFYLRASACFMVFSAIPFIMLLLQFYVTPIAVYVQLMWAVVGRNGIALCQIFVFVPSPACCMRLISRLPCELVKRACWQPARRDEIVSTYGDEVHFTGAVS